MHKLNYDILIQDADVIHVGKNWLCGTDARSWRQM